MHFFKILIQNLIRINTWLRDPLPFIHRIYIYIYIYFLFSFRCYTNSYFFYSRIQPLLTRTVIGYYMYYYYIHIGQIAQRERIIESQKVNKKVVVKRNNHIFIHLVFYQRMRIHINSIIEEKKIVEKKKKNWTPPKKQ